MRRLIFLILLFTVCSKLFAISQHPFYEKRYVARSYDSKSFQSTIFNRPCVATYQEVSLRGKTPSARHIRNFQYHGVRSPAFLHPYIRDVKEFLAMSWDTKDETPRSVIKIPVAIPIPEYARSFGIFIGGDGFSTNKISIIIEENGKDRIYTLKSSLLKQTYISYLFSLNRSFKRTLKAIYIRGESPTVKTLIWPPEKKQAFIGPIFFSSISIPDKLQEVQTQENIFTPLSFQLQALTSEEPIHSTNYSIIPVGLWHKDDSLFLNFENLQMGILEIYAYLKDRVTHTFVMRLFVSGIQQGNPNSQTCVQVSLPKDVVTYQQKNSGGVYFNLLGVRWISADGTPTASPKLSKAFLQRENWQLYTYPINNQ